MKQFLRWSPPKITQVARLVQHIAPLCRLLRSTVMEQLDFEARSSAPDDDIRARPFTGLKNDWRRLLFPSADNATFADGYAQTVTFALLLARTEDIPLAPNSFHEIGRRWTPTTPSWAKRSSCRPLLLSSLPARRVG
ncbi:hypothetical protein [Streptomyces sp. NPDC057257]|uniref:hypothetical protein n=1 Tax=Streptomyces sp. NPDC057257 TaxID=3346071 RepID=UPI00363EBD7C